MEGGTERRQKGGREDENKQTRSKNSGKKEKERWREAQKGKGG